ncbi:MAG TPA: hypothetical protein VIJ22_00275 [Polyangiaceae bacterium]
MKPVAPALLADDEKAPQPTLHSEIRALCDTREAHERITLPAPPTDEALRASTPFPPPRDPDAPVDTMPAPPPSSCRRRTDSHPDGETGPSTIPGPPRVPRIAGC